MSQKLSAVAELAVKYVNTTDRHIFLTGKAGSGKTTLLRYLVEKTYKNAVVAAPTGIAAINAGGVTLHSLLQLPFGTFVPEELVRAGQELSEKLNTPKSVIGQLQMGSTKRKLLREIELLIIDEVSMLRADLLDCIDLILKHVRRKRSVPFGGVQLLFIGDLNQLPPVVKNSEWPLLSRHYKSAYFFDSQVLKQTPPVYIELDKIYRQSDPEFLGILNRLRDNKLQQGDVKTLNAHFKKDVSTYAEDGYIHITTHNRKADLINDRELEKLESSRREYKAKITGDFPENMYPLSDAVVLKEGAQVMFIKNDPSGEAQYYNGKIGKVISLTYESIAVELDGDSEVVEVKTYLWENKRYKLNADTGQVEEKVIGTYEQYPVKLAWAITVHKSQGLTFEKAILDLSESFAPGQMYVALSRLTSMEGLVLSALVPESGINTDNALMGFVGSKKAVDDLQEELKQDRKQFLLNYAQVAFDFTDILIELNNHLKGFDKDENRSAKQKYKDWTVELLNDAKPLQEVAVKFIRQLAKIVIEEGEDYLKIIYERVQKASGYFLPLLQSLSQKIKEHKKQVNIQKQVKGYSKELKDIESLFDRKVMQIQKVELLISHAVENKVLTKEDLTSSDFFKRTARKKDKKESKVPTKEITYGLYRGGKSVEEIAELRGLTQGTIEGHLCTYVISGDLEATDLMDGEKMKNILTVMKTLGTTSSGEIKSKLGDEYEYGEIRIALAYHQFTNKG
ncbi:helix-turn-helix domain-containing protein [Fulvivirga sp. 29W222]|uniref:Helix-turn-helix domain-containing protein n=1 Tax=Fulvivirga marina TaxID=2494733 RepID=A0A937KC93_9BACT|nr:helix-turn-helix domain-containing protein [Fulvivirga marina]MBL6447272.1 helix-turn-helix domain-containing protein [Fulvivirga marina]